MVDKIKKTIEKYSLLKKGDCVTVGLSGGADSIALISVLYAIKDEYSLTLSAVHVNHGIRGEEAKRDEDFVISFCKERGILLTVFHRNVPFEAKENGESQEECGRRIRYECFGKAANGGLIATAHTLSDSIETMIFNMLRGSSLAGLCAIPEKRGNIIRPVIECTREEIEKYCKENSLNFVTDSTNLKTDYTRNYIRREIMPMFGKVNAAYMVSLSRLKDFITQDNAYLDEKARNLLFDCMHEDRIDISVLLNADMVLVKRAIVMFIKEKCSVFPESRHIELICENLRADFVLQICKDRYICIKSGFLFAESKSVKLDIKKECLPLCEGINKFKDHTVTAEKISREKFLNNYNKLLENAVDCDKINGEILIRSRKEGDSIFLCKRKVTKSLKKLFCEMKVPKEKRDDIPVVCDAEKVLWVYGVGVNGECRAERRSENIIVFGTSE